jgi:hypothetical protein
VSGGLLQRAGGLSAADVLPAAIGVFHLMREKLSGTVSVLLAIPW